MRDQNFSMRCSQEFKTELEDIRRWSPGLPSAAEVLHTLVSKEWSRLHAKQAKALMQKD